MKDVNNWTQLGAARALSAFMAATALRALMVSSKDNALFAGISRPPSRNSRVRLGVQGVTRDKNGIGYSGMGYRTSGREGPGHRAKGSSDYVAANARGLCGQVPPAPLPLHLHQQSPNKGADPVVTEFIKYVLSKDGQEVTVKDGFLPLSADTDKTESAKVD